MSTGDSLLPSPTLELATALGGAILAATWLSLILWTARDIRARSDDRLTRILAVIAVALLTVPGLLLYLLLRPVRTLEEEYQSSLEEEALIATLAGRLTCPGCGRQVETARPVRPSCAKPAPIAAGCLISAGTSARTAGLQPPPRKPKRTPDQSIGAGAR
jgi:hypothetical protein